MANGAPISLTPQFQRFGISPQAPFQEQPQQQRRGGNIPLALALGAAGQGLIQGGQRGGLGTALLGATSAAIPAFIGGQQMLLDRQAAEDERAAALAQQELENQRARQKALFEADKQRESTRRFGVTEGRLAGSAAEGVRQFGVTEQRLGDTAAGQLAVGQGNLALRGQEFARGPAPGALQKVFDPATGMSTFQPRSEAIGKFAQPPTGIELTTDPTTGATTFRTGVQGGQAQGGQAFGKKATGNIETQLTDLSAARQRLGNIASEFNPDFLTLQTRAGMSVKEMRDKVGLLPADQQAQLADFTRFRQNTIANLNRTIKEITGAAMNQQEVPRIQGEVPVATDSPAVFETKLRNSLRLAGLAQARLVHLRNQGVTPGQDFGGIGLDDMPSIMDARGTEVEQALIAQGFDPAVAEQQALAQVRQEFGF